MRGYTQSIWISGNEIIKILQDRGFILKNTKEILRTEFKMSRTKMYDKYPFLKDPDQIYTFQFKFAYLPEERSNVMWKLINNLNTRLDKEKGIEYYRGKYSWSTQLESEDLWNYLADVRCRKIVCEEFNKKILNGEY